MPDRRGRDFGLMTVFNFFRAEGQRQQQAFEEKLKNRDISQRRREARSSYFFEKATYEANRLRAFAARREERQRLDECRKLKPRRAFGLSLYVDDEPPAPGEPELACDGPVRPEILELRPGEQAFNMQRYGAQARGIVWELTYEEWWNWWQIDNRWTNRGAGPEQLVMCRKGDVGPYSLDNIYCTTQVQNTRDAHRFRKERSARDA